MDWKNNFKQEIDMASAARARGNEGQARVCARRAAGVVAREYFQRLGRPLHNPSAYDLLMELLTLDDLPELARQSLQNLTQRVTEEFELPEGIDLLLEARSLAASLLPQD